MVPSDDAAKAGLKEKTYLDGLLLKWGDDTKDRKNHKDVLEKLEPHTNSKRLNISFYCDVKFPDWLGDFSFSHMVSLHLSNCMNCLLLPPVGQLPSLRVLIVEWMTAVKRLGPEFYGMDKPFQSLVTLTFEGMWEWEEWVSFEVEGREFPCLQELYIRGCPKLKGNLPKQLPSVVKVEISESKELVNTLMAEESLQKRLLDYHDNILFVSDETGSAESSLSKSQYAAAAECSLPMTQGVVQSSFNMTLGATQSSLAITQGVAVAECSLPVAQSVAAAECSFSMIQKVNNGSPEMLKNKLQSLLLVVDDAEEKQYRSKVAKEWLDELPDVVYDKEGLIDEIHTKGFQHRLDEILNRVESLAKRKDELGLKIRIEHNMEKSLRMPAASFGDDNSKVIFGRESDKKEIIDLLHSNDANGRKLSVISVLANDSMGKTTLARLIYKDHRVTEHFDLKAWAYVSDLSDTFMVTKAVFESFTLQSCDLKEQDVST